MARAIEQLKQAMEVCELGALTLPDQVDALMDAARAILQEISTLTPPNEPLTLEELSLCNDPVWIKRLADRNLSDDGWAIVEGPRCLTWHNRIPVSWEILVWWPGSEVEDCPKYENYGKTWIAYRRSPERQEDL